MGSLRWGARRGDSGGCCMHAGCTHRYRTRDEISSIRTQRDPVEHVRKLLLDHNLADTAELKKTEKARLCLLPSPVPVPCILLQ